MLKSTLLVSLFLSLSINFAQASALESFGIGGEKKSPMAKMSEKFSELFNAIRLIQKGNVGFIEGFKQLFNKTSNLTVVRQIILSFL